MDALLAAGEELNRVTTTRLAVPTIAS